MFRDIAPLLVSGLFFLTPIVWILTKHQQKMAMILNGQGQMPQYQPGTSEAELAALRDTVHRQTLAIDDLARSQAELRSALESRERLADRVSGLN